MTTRGRASDEAEGSGALTCALAAVVAGCHRVRRDAHHAQRIVQRGTAASLVIARIARNAVRPACAPRLPPGSACVSMASKAERWAARARAVHAGSAPDPSARGAAAEDPPAGDCGQEPAGVQAGRARHDQGHLEWTLPQQAARGSAMEAWLARAEAKQLHLPWPGKIRDYADEVKCVKVRRARARAGVQTCQNAVAHALPLWKSRRV